jgi:hypothetical protein
VADVYGIVPADIEAELTALFPAGFTPTTKPTAGQVASFIAQEDLKVAIAVQNASGTVPSSSDRLAPLAKMVIVYRVVARVLRIVYAAQAPERVDAAASPYDALARDAQKSITDLQTQATGVGDPPNRVVSSSTVPERDLLVSDDDLGLRGWTRGQY